MYNEFYGLNQEPFRLTPDPEFFFLGEDHNKSLAHLMFGINNRKGFIALTGEVGAGKTTLCRLLLKQLDDNVSVAIILNSLVDELTFLKQINRDFSIPYETDSHDDLVSYLYDFLIEEKRKDRNVLIIVDECQNLKFEVLEQIRMLSNLETEKDKLLQILLIGQPEFLDMLNSHQLRQLNQRITVRAHISAFKLNEMEKYIYHRLAIAGNGQAVTFNKKAFKMIFKYSKGIPRRVNVICDYALLAGYVQGTRNISKNEVNKAIDDIEIKRDKKFKAEEDESNVKSSKKGNLRPVFLCAVFLLTLIYFKDILMYQYDSYYKNIIKSPLIIDAVNGLQTINIKRLNHISNNLKDKGKGPVKNVLLKPAKESETKNSKEIPQEISNKNAPVKVIEKTNEVSPVQTAPIQKPVEPVEKTQAPKEMVPVLEPKEKPLEENIVEKPKSTSPKAKHYFENINVQEKGIWLLLSTWGIEINHPRKAANGKFVSLLEQLQRFNFFLCSTWADLPLIVKINIPCAMEVLINEKKQYWVLNGLKNDHLRFYIAPGKNKIVNIKEFEDIWQGNSFFILEKGENTLDNENALFKGMENDQIAKMGEILTKLGFFSGKVYPVFDLDLEKSVIEFQKKMGLTPDGIIGVEAKLLFYSILSKNIPRILSREK